MINQRGQAFSVFELMIAAIVAIAILFVLLPIVNNITTPTGDAISTIGNTLSSNTYTKKDTSAFTMDPGATIFSSAFSSKGIDECSFYFDKGRLSEKQVGIEFDDDLEDGCDFAMTNLQSSVLKAKATVICATDSTDLEKAIENAKLSDVISHTPSEVWGEGDDYVGFDKVCIVILQYTS
ncbi:MAG: hypothetical protein WC915_02175 [archaeon]|jgi:hypothetical protein